MNKINSRVYLIIIFIIGLILRCVALGGIPPGIPEIFLSRLISALSGSFSIVIIYFLSLKLSGYRRVALFSALSFAILPVSIVESRLTSWVSILSLVIMVAWLFLYKKSFFYKILGLMIFIVSLFLFRREIWILSGGYFNINIKAFLTNFFNVLSFDKLFFINDSYWIGGLRRYGMLYPESIPIFLVGIYELIIKKVKIFFFFASIIIVIASLNPLYPEARELGLLAPMLAIILGFGGHKIFTWIYPNRSRLLVITLGISYFLIICYGILNFFHYYFVHYNLQIKQERLYETKKF